MAHRRRAEKCRAKAVVAAWHRFDDVIYLKPGRSARAPCRTYTQCCILQQQHTHNPSDQNRKSNIRTSDGVTSLRLTATQQRGAQVRSTRGDAVRCTDVAFSVLVGRV